jgi:hypothetical protein
MAAELSAAALYTDDSSSPTLWFIS